MKSVRKVKKTKSKSKAILKATMELFLEKGYAATSTNDICSAAGIKKGTLYYYFRSKRDLLFQIHIQSLKDDLLPSLEQARSIQDPWERFVFLLEDHTRKICTLPELRVLIHETFSIKDDSFENIRKLWKKHYLIVRDTVSELVSTGEFPADLNISYTALLLLGMTTWITFWVDYSRKEEIDKIVDSVMRFALSLRVKKPS